VRIALDLAALADEELALVLDGRVDELDALHARREVLMAQLPPTLSGPEVGVLRQAAGVQQLVTLALTEQHAAIRNELAGLQLGRTTARGYGRTGL
jgi:hypothetical protein